MIAHLMVKVTVFASGCELINFCYVAGIKKYIVELIIKTSSDPETMESKKMYLNKLNMILVQVKSLLQPLLFFYFHQMKN